MLMNLDLLSEALMTMESIHDTLLAAHYICDCATDTELRKKAETVRDDAEFCYNRMNDALDEIDHAIYEFYDVDVGTLNDTLNSSPDMDRMIKKLRFSDRSKWKDIVS